MTQNPRPANRTRNQDADVHAMTGVIVSALDEAKGIDIKVLNVRKLTDVTDCMVIVTGSSDRVREHASTMIWKGSGTTLSAVRNPRSKRRKFHEKQSASQATERLEPAIIFRAMHNHQPRQRCVSVKPGTVAILAGKLGCRLRIPGNPSG